MTEVVRTTRLHFPVGLDTSRPSIARVYDYSIGGKDNYRIDAQAWRRITDVARGFGEVHKMNRAWLARVTRYLAQSVGLTQFLDLGAGIPAVMNTHQFAREWRCRDMRVVYVDHDPVCVAHGRALLEDNETVHYIPGDLADPDQILQSSAARVYLDLDLPVGLLLTGVLHHLLTGRDRPAQIVARYIDLLPVGSYVAITHYYDPGPADPQGRRLVRELELAFLDSGLGPVRFRTKAQITELFGGLTLVEPGLVELDDWWPSGPSVPRNPEERLIVGAVAYKRPGSCR
ncbi:SAM-dependent methyltransferase [Nocardia sp. NPDC058499]|uniref:SAM-dependent methyltransferase n=1 Tax=Nocardia sp. NPDC058499 TaxID=3346530 RepID=UPI00365450C3